MMSIQLPAPRVTRSHRKRHWSRRRRLRSICPKKMLVVYIYNLLLNRHPFHVIVQTQARFSKPSVDINCRFVIFEGIDLGALQEPIPEQQHHIGSHLARRRRPCLLHCISPGLWEELSNDLVIDFEANQIKVMPKNRSTSHIIHSPSWTPPRGFNK